MKILLVGGEATGSRLLRWLLHAGHQISGVLTAEPGSPGHGPLWCQSIDAGLPTFPGRLVKDPGIADHPIAADVDLVLNAHSLHIVHPALLEVASIGAFNLHPGLLPRYGGLNSASWSIFNGEAKHGVTLHWMEPTIDTGAIAYRAEFGITPRDTALSVNARGTRTGLELVAELVETAEKYRRVPRIEQDRQAFRYYGKEVPWDGRVRWDQPAVAIDRLVRACDYGPYPSPWGRALTDDADGSLGIVRCELTDRASDAIPGTVSIHDGVASVACGDRWLAISTVDRAGEIRPARDVLVDGALLGD